MRPQPSKPDRHRCLRVSSETPRHLGRSYGPDRGSGSGNPQIPVSGKNKQEEHSRRTDRSDSRAASRERGGANGIHNSGVIASPAPSARFLGSRTAASGARVCLMINIEQPLLRDVGVDLGGRQITVAEKLLHTAKIGAAIEQVRGETVPQRVRAGRVHQSGTHQMCL